jgi:hypothetical protein
MFFAGMMFRAMRRTLTHGYSSRGGSRPRVPTYPHGYCTIAHRSPERVTPESRGSRDPLLPVVASFWATRLAETRATRSSDHGVIRASGRVAHDQSGAATTGCRVCRPST